MTIIASVKKGNKVVIGADSFYGSQYSRLHSSDTSKLFRIENFVVGISGISEYREAIEDLKWKKKITKKKHAREFVGAVNRKIRDLYADGWVADPEKSAKSGQLIIATPKRIFEVYNNMSSFEFDRYTAEGAGMTEALGALESLYDLIEDPAEVLERALLTTCKLNPMCAEPLEIIEV